MTLPLVHSFIISPRMVQGSSGEGVENNSDSIFALRKRLVGINEQHGDFNFFFSRLDPFLVLSSELSLLSFEC